MNIIKDNANKMIDVTNRPNYINTLECLDQLQGIGGTISTLLEVQEIDDFFNVPVSLPANAKPWQCSKPILNLKFDHQSSCALDVFKDIKQLACVGLPNEEPQNVVYAKVEFHDSLDPESEPFYLACTVHLGARIDWEHEVEIEPFDLLRHASYLQARKSASRDRCDSFPFIYKGKSFFYQLRDSKLEVIGEEGFVIIAGDGE